MTALGVSLLIIGAIVVVAEAHLPSMGLLGGPGVVALTIGTVLAVGGLGGGLLLGLVSALVVAARGERRARCVAAEGRRGPPTAGPERSRGPDRPRRRRAQLGGADRSGDGRRCSLAARHVAIDEDEQKLEPGEAVVVERLSGLTLAVRRAEEWELTL